jgi:hypothetical protein
VDIDALIGSLRPTLAGKNTSGLEAGLPTHRCATVARPEDLEGVDDIDEAVVGRHSGRPAFHLRPLHLDRASAHPADQMVMVMVGVASPVAGLTVLAA